MARAGFWGQFKALVWKNLLLKRRNKKQTYQEILMPIYFIAILAMIKALIKPETFPAIGNFQTTTVVDNRFLGHLGEEIYATPNKSENRNIMLRVVSFLGQNNMTVRYRMFNTEDEAVTAYKENSDKVFAGVFFDASDYTSYSIRTPFKSIASAEDVFHDQSQCRGTSDGLAKDNCDVNTYLYSGFAALQVVLDRAIMNHEQNKNEGMPDVKVEMMPKSGFIPDTSYIQILASLYFIIAYSPFINFLTVNLVAEKEKKIKEGMKMMGLRDSAFWLSWTVIYVVIIAIVTVVVILISVVSKFFANSNMFLFFLMLMLYGVSIIGISFAMTPFFSKAQVAGGMASLASMLISMLYLIVSLTRTYSASGVSYSIPVWGRYLLCLFSPVSLALAIDQAIYLDIANPDGMTFSTASQGEFPLLAPILMLVLDTVLYFFLAVYLDNVIPGEYGPRYSPWFIFMPSYWCPKKTDRQPKLGYGATDSESGDVEKVSEEVKAKTAVSINQLSKEFKAGDETIRAVNGLSLEIYENQITAILGHNGAGKTTTMNILTGLTGATDGHATIMGLDVSNPSDMEEIRSMTGVCPQHNILFDELTCLEHLNLFAGIKGVTMENQEEEITAALNSVGLKDQMNVRSAALSGGQKRKLSVAIAIIGDPKIIFLDEPSAGMDPFSRRHLWSVLKEKKQGRIILLTTHFMDEADILADRKAIINKGKLRCCGSSLFLKNRFGIGYHLNMVVESDANMDNIKGFIQGKVSGMEVNRQHGQEVDIMLPLDKVSQFSDLFSNLEASMKDLGVLNYGVSMTTLEEVFLELEKSDEADLKELRKRRESHRDKSHTEGAEGDTEKDQGAHETVVSLDHTDHIKLELVTNTHEEHVKKLNEGFTLMTQQFRALFKIRVLQNLRNRQLIFYQLFLPLLFLIIGLIVNKNSHPDYQGGSPPSLQIQPCFYGYQRPPQSTGCSGLSPPVLIKDSVDNATSRTAVADLSSIYVVQNLTSMSDLLSISPHFIGINLTQYSNESTQASVNIKVGYTAVYNDSAVHSIPAIINLVSNLIYQQETGSGVKKLKVKSHPWPTSTQPVKESQAAFSSVILLAMAFAVIPGGFGVTICRDREPKVRNQLKVTGVPFVVYWGTWFTLDAIKFFIPAVLIIIITFIAKVASLMESGAIVALILLSLTYIPVNILMSYNVSFFFTSWESAQAVQPLIFFFSAFMPYLPVALVDQSGSEHTASILHNVFCAIFPPYTMFGGLFYIDKVYRVAEAKFATASIVFSDYFNENILIAIFLPLVHLFLFSLLLRLFDVRSVGGTVKEAFGCHSNLVANGDEIEDADRNEDADVKAERERVKQIRNQKSEDHVALVSNLRKEFSKDGTVACFKRKASNTKVAVRNSSFAVDAGQVFGLLGPNGAGKSTTLSMMTADISPTNGEVLVGGHDIHDSQSDAFSAMGYCPQYDPLFDIATLEEHLRCYAMLRGIPTDKIDAVVQFYKGNLKLDEHSKKFSKNLSGGTKRKLSYCMSMMGKPRVVLLDEPSTGMDPQSKRFLWDTISSSFQGSERGAILTTHYMEEADALCSRIAIMVNGRLKCVGSSQHLKNKYGSGYLLEIKLNIDDAGPSTEARMEQLHQYILGHFQGAELLERFSERAQYKIPRDDVKSLAMAFDVLEKGKQNHNIEEYNFSQSTLEQVFLEFAKHQSDEGETVEEEQSDHL